MKKIASSYFDAIQAAIALRNLVFIILLTANMPIQAQHKISGKVMDGNSPLDAANIVLNTKDSVYLKGTSSNSKGTFHLKDIPTGDFFLVISYLGYGTKVVALDKLSQSVNIGEIRMTPVSGQLDEVTVSASNVINHTDKQIVFVTDQHRSTSTNGVNLLLMMGLPRLTVNPLTNDVSLPGGESIQFCINGVKVNRTDIKALQPQEIIRVEYMDNPGIRYGSDVVINYILKREISGGAISVDLSNAINTNFNEDQLSARLNHKKSEFRANYVLNSRNLKKSWTDQQQTFNFTDGSSLTRYKEGVPGKVLERSHNIALNYNLMDNDKYLFTASLNQSIRDVNLMNRSRQYTSAEIGKITDVYGGGQQEQYLPSINLYYLRTLKNKQTIILDVVGTYIDTKVNRKYEETENGSPLADIISDVDGDKYSIISEGIYEKIFKNSGRLTANLRYMQSFTDNQYTGTINSSTKMRQNDFYFGAEYYSGRKKKFSYTGGVGIARSWFQQTNEKEYIDIIFRPKFTLQYDVTPNMFLRMTGSISNNSPSLSQMSAVDQYIDTLNIQRGNPALKPFLNYSTNMMLSWRKDIYNATYYLTYQYIPKNIMEDTFRENDIFVSTQNNQKSWQRLGNELSINAGPIKKFLMISFTGGINRYISRGNLYTHNHTDFYYQAQITAIYKKFMGMFQIKEAYYAGLSGETLAKGEDAHLFMLRYNSGKYSIGAGIMNPFTKLYKRETESRNIYTPSKSTLYVNDLSRMVILSFSWNFNYKRLLKEKQKRINNKDVDSGIMQDR